MALLNITPFSADNISPSIVRIDTNDSTPTVLTPNYLSSAKRSLGYTFSNKQMALVSVVDNGVTSTIWAEVSISADGNISLNPSISEGNIQFPVTVGDLAVFTNVDGQIGSTGSLAANRVLQSDITNPVQNSNVIYVDNAIDYASLSSGGQQILFIPQSQSYLFREIWLSGLGINFVGGDRDITIKTIDGDVYTVIPSATLLALANARWGDAQIPYPPIISVLSGFVNNIVAEYSGGTTDYTSGELVIDFLFQKV